MAAPKAKRKGKGGGRAKGAPEPSLNDKLAEAAWAQADAALAEALADLDEVEGAPNDAARGEALAMLAQSLQRAARKRGLTRIGAIGAREPFDPDRHDLIGAKTPKTVTIRARGVARGKEILVRPRAGPSQRKAGDD